MSKSIKATKQTPAHLTVADTDPCTAHIILAPPARFNKGNLANPASGSEAAPSSQHRRRTSRSFHASATEGLKSHQPPVSNTTATAAAHLGDHPFHEEDETHHMSLDRSPSPNRNGGWSSPGLTAPFDDDHNHGTITPPGVGPGSSPYSRANGAGGVTWANAKKRSARVNGHPSYQSTNQGFFTRHMRKLSESLPRFANAPETGLKDKPGRSPSGRRSWKELPRHLALLISRRRKLVLMILLPIVLLCILFSPRESTFPANFGLLMSQSTDISCHSREILVPSKHCWR